MKITDLLTENDKKNILTKYEKNFQYLSNDVVCQWLERVMHDINDDEISLQELLPSDERFDGQSFFQTLNPTDYVLEILKTDLVLDSCDNLSNVLYEYSFDKFTLLIENLLSYDCQHDYCSIDECCGDAESGPITYSLCNDCGKGFREFGM